MSRKGKLPITIPSGVEVNVKDGVIHVKGPKGLLKQDLHSCVKITIENHSLTVEVDENVEESNAMHGLYRTLIDNMVHGATKGFEKQLEMIGVGYRAAVKGHDIDLQVGNSHPTLMRIPEGLQVKIEKGTQITISGMDKRVVGQFAAEIRAKKPPEPYQGKGIRYVGEYVRKKAGKSAAASK